MTDEKLTLSTKNIKGIKARSLAAVSLYTQTLIESLSSLSLLEAVSFHVRLASPADYKQLSLNNPIKAALQELGYIKPSNTILTVSVPVNVSEPCDIQNFNEGRYNRTIIELTTDNPNDLSIEGITAHAGDHLKVVKVERNNAIIYCVNIKSGVRHEFELNNLAFQRAIQKAKFYYESVINLSAGDIVFQLNDPEALKQVESITDKEIILKDIKHQLTTFQRDSVESRLLSLGYAANGELAQHFKTEITIIIIDGDDKSQYVKSFIKDVTANTSQHLHIFGVEKTLRKSLQIVCPADMMKSIEEAIALSGKTNRGYLESLIEKLITKAKKTSDEKDQGYMVLYSSPPLSKANAFWVSEKHFDMLKAFCDEAGLKVNPVAHHLIMRDLKKRGLVILNKLLM